MRVSSIKTPAIGRTNGRRATGGVVHYYIHRSSGHYSGVEFTSGKLIEILKRGLEVRELDDLQDSLGLTMDELVRLLGISKATFHRRRTTGRLALLESDRVVRLARLLGKAVEVLESESGARQWLRSPQVGLGGAVPLEYAQTEVGAREVEDLLGRIEFGVYS